MIPPFDADDDLPQGPCIRPRGQRSENDSVSSHARIDGSGYAWEIEQMIEEAQASHIVERILFGGSFVTSKSEPNDFDCIIVLKAETRYEELLPFSVLGSRYP